MKIDRSHPIYLIYGEESYIVEDVIKQLKEAIVHPDWMDMNLTTFDLLKEPIELAIEDAETFPFGEGKRLVIAKNAFFLTGAQVRSNVEHTVDALLNYLENPTNFSTLVLVVPYEKLDERKKIVKELGKKAHVIQAKRFEAADWDRWIQSRLKEKEIRLDAQGMDYLLRYLPHDMRMAENELEKVALYQSSDNESLVPMEVLEGLISRTVEGDVFTLVERVANQDFASAYTLYQELLKQNEEPIKILALLARQFRIILQAKYLSNQGYMQKQIAAQLKLHPYPVKLAMEQGRAFSEEDLCCILERISESDYKMKTGQIDKQLALELILLTIKPHTKRKRPM